MRSGITLRFVLPFPDDASLVEATSISKGANRLRPCRWGLTPFERCDTVRWRRSNPLPRAVLYMSFVVPCLSGKTLEIAGNGGEKPDTMRQNSIQYRTGTVHEEHLVRQKATGLGIPDDAGPTVQLELLCDAGASGLDLSVMARCSFAAASRGFPALSMVPMLVIGCDPRSPQRQQIPGHPGTR